MRLFGLIVAMPMLAVTNTSPWLSGSGSRNTASSRSATTDRRLVATRPGVEHDVLVAGEAGDHRAVAARRGRRRSATVRST